MTPVKYDWLFIVIFLVFNGRQFGLGAAPPVQNAFDDDINTCLFYQWKSVVSGNVKCSGYGSNFKELCYGLGTSAPALFAVCYDTKKLIPAFTAHVVNPVTGSSSDRPDFKPDKGKFKPPSQAEVKDYSANQQEVNFPEFDFKKNYYCAKGHLVPNADYGTNAPKAATTFILTNAAPQWQKFNGGNWLIMEKAVRDYSNNSGNNLYVFTGTGGEAKNSKGAVYKLNLRVTAPAYYWILVCDVKIKQMVIFVGENPVGTQSTSKKAGCNGQQTENLGVMQCYSYDDVKKESDYSDFKLPTMNKANCPTNKMGTFLKPKFG